MNDFTFFDQLRAYFEPGLVYLFLISAVCYITYRLTFAKGIHTDFKSVKNSLNKKARKDELFRIRTQHIDNIFKKTIFFFADLFWVLFIVVFLRSFIIEPFIIPSPSMHPGLVEGDVVAVNKSSYGIKVPLTKMTFLEKEPKKGDVIVFKYPRQENISFIKRVVGEPGDKVKFDRKNKLLTINNVAIKINSNDKSESIEVFDELFSDKKHLVQYQDRRPNTSPVDLVVPADSYFVMGDNRDNSDDSRSWGFVPKENLIGKAYGIIMNFECLKGKGNCDHFFKKIQ